MENNSYKEISVPVWIPPIISKKICFKLKMKGKQFRMQVDHQYKYTWEGEE